MDREMCVKDDSLRMHEGQRTSSATVSLTTPKGEAAFALMTAKQRTQKAAMVTTLY